MTPSFDPARLAELPADLRAELRAMFEAQRAMLEAERIRADHELAARLHIESELAASKETVERLQLLVREYERARFGKRSEKLDPDQLQLVLEDIEIAIAEVQEREDDRARRSGRPATRERAGRAARAYPAHLPRVEQRLSRERALSGSRSKKGPCPTCLSRSSFLPAPS
ncbi:transposase [Methylosinus sp. LW3]|uniref:transposase n=1 Tax=Methylosinus sp. LW3 TaxID=107635 RepID=UPI0004AC626C|nr:transposase [Methylosinus sp. LW3]